ncbi:MAG: biotin--[Muribaculaceae bacterium]|nr:biotin--[acetyl-CoA-carboxylase] ligase [Muribaculaceae bacterium]
MPNIIVLQETASTNDYIKRNAQILPTGTVIIAVRQTAGRGQKGNSWEAEPGKNVTLSLLVKRPNVEVKEQFAISEAVSLAIVDELENYASGFKIKWPNDIYYGNRKIGGILIEHTLDAKGIEYTIAGVGLNINQQVFVSGAPNPVSLFQITG